MARKKILIKSQERQIINKLKNLCYCCGCFLLGSKEYFLGVGPVVELLPGHLPDHAQVVLDPAVVVTYKNIALLTYRLFLLLD